MENVFTASQPFLVLLKAFGLFPISFKASNGKKQKIKLWDFLVPICSLNALICMTCANFLHFKSVESESAILTNSYHFAMIGGFASILLMTCYQWCKYKSALKFLATINKFDSKV